MIQYIMVDVQRYMPYGITIYLYLINLLEETVGGGVYNRSEFSNKICK